MNLTGSCAARNGSVLSLSAAYRERHAGGLSRISLTVIMFHDYTWHRIFIKPKPRRHAQWSEACRYIHGSSPVGLITLLKVLPKAAGDDPCARAEPGTQ